MHRLQSALVHVNALLVEPSSAKRLGQRVTDTDRRALTSLFWTHVNLYVRRSP
jgi:hypothetical protein